MPLRRSKQSAAEQPRRAQDDDDHHRTEQAATGEPLGVPAPPRGKVLKPAAAGSPELLVGCTLIADLVSVFNHARSEQLALRPVTASQAAHAAATDARDRSDDLPAYLLELHAAETLQPSRVYRAPRARRRSRNAVTAVALTATLVAAAVIAVTYVTQQPRVESLTGTYTNQRIGYSINYPAAWQVRRTTGAFVGNAVQQVLSHAVQRVPVGGRPHPGRPTDLLSITPAGLAPAAIRVTSLPTDLTRRDTDAVANVVAHYVIPQSERHRIRPLDDAVSGPWQGGKQATFRGDRWWNEVRVVVGDDIVMVFHLTAPNRRALRRLRPTWQAMFDSVAHSILTPRSTLLAARRRG